jgi:hypothetical protein
VRENSKDDEVDTKIQKEKLDFETLTICAYTHNQA